MNRRELLKLGLAVPVAGKLFVHDKDLTLPETPALEGPYEIDYDTMGDPLGRMVSVELTYAPAGQLDVYYGPKGTPVLNLQFLGSIITDRDGGQYSFGPIEVWPSTPEALKKYRTYVINEIDTKIYHKAHYVEFWLRKDSEHGDRGGQLISMVYGPSVRIDTA